MKKPYTVLKTFTLGKVRYDKEEHKDKPVSFHPRKAEFLVHGGFLKPHGEPTPKKPASKKEDKQS